MESNDSVKIAYAPVQERTFPEKVFFKAFLEAPNFAKTKTKGLFKGSKEGLFHILKGQLLPPEYDSVEDAGFGAAMAKKGKAVFLYNSAGEQLAGGDCSAVKTLSEAMFAKQCGGKWGVYSMVNGAEILPCRYSFISEIKEDSFVLRDGNDAVVAGLDGKPILPGTYRYANPFVNGFARVGTKDTLDYVSRDGEVIYSGAGLESRDFCNGYAVIADRKGKLGAIDAEGRVVVEPQYLFMRDFGDGFFLVSNTGTKGADGNFNGRDYGAVSGGGKVIVPLSKLFIGPHGDGKIMFGRGEIWQVTSGNTRTAYRVAIMGVADADGKILLPEKYAYIGNESEGLIPFKSFENNVMTLGYMRPDGTTAITVARHDYTGDVTDRPALRADTSEQIGAFTDGKARVTVRKSHRTTGVFDKTTRDAVVNAAAPYWIDREGNETTPPEPKEGGGAAPADPALCGDLPFADRIKAMSEGMRGLYVKVRPFGLGGMTELRAGESSFAIFGADGKLACAKWDGTDLKAVPAPLHSEYSTLQPAGGGLWAGLKKTADGKQDKPVFWISEFESPTVFGDGLAPFRVADGKNWLWGYTDLLGNTVVEPKYRTATGFEYGRAYAVKPDGTEAILARVLMPQ